MDSAPLPPGWAEAQDPTSGKSYYYRPGVADSTQWTRPEAESSAGEWAKHFDEGQGKHYYYNTVTKVTQWEEPDALKQRTEPPVQPSRLPAGPSSALQPYGQDFGRERNSSSRLAGYARHELSSTFTPAKDEPDYLSRPDAEAAFIKMLKRHGAQADWTWEQALQVCIRDPQFRALKDSRDRMTIFQDYVSGLDKEQKDRERERLAKLRQNFTTMLRNHEEIQHSTQWDQAVPVLERETVFRSTDNDSERRQFFEEYIQTLQTRHVEKLNEDHKLALQELPAIFDTLDLKPYSKWEDAEELLQGNERYQNDDKFRTLLQSNVLTGFDNYVKTLELRYNEQKQAGSLQKKRNQRLLREKFNGMIREFRSQNKLKPGSKWTEVRGLFADHAEFAAVLQEFGAKVLDLWLSYSMFEDRDAKEKREIVRSVLDRQKFRWSISTDYPTFQDAVRRDRRVREFPDEVLRAVYDREMERTVDYKNKRRDKDDRHHSSDRRTTDSINDLRSRIKRLDPPVRLSESWEAVRPRLEKYAEFKDLTEDHRVQAFDKHIRRLKDKDRDSEMDYEYSHRDDRRNGRRSNNGRSSYTPEDNAYEEDRRKFQEVRERQHRRGGTGLSPPPSRAHDHYRPSSREGHYDNSLSRDDAFDRDRRHRDHQRLYSSRADPRDRTVSALDYDEGSSAVSTHASQRRRRESEYEDPRKDTKRSRRDSLGSYASNKERSDRSRTSKEPSAPPKEEHYKSGSEEGEIEED